MALVESSLMRLTITTSRKILIIDDHAVVRDGVKRIFDEQSEAGGSLLGSTDRIDGAPAAVESANVAGRIAKGAVVSAPSYRRFRIVPMLHRTQTF